jgi:hypothetical protein
MRTAYSSGSTCFGSFPGVLAKSNGFSALKIVAKIKEKAAGKRRREESIRPLNAAVTFEQGAAIFLLLLIMILLLILLEMRSARPGS